MNLRRRMITMARRCGAVSPPPSVSSRTIHPPVRCTDKGQPAALHRYPDEVRGCSSASTPRRRLWFGMRRGTADLGGRLVLAQPLIDNLPQQIVVGPGEKLHLGDELGPHPMH